MHAQGSPERTDTIRGADFSDRVIASAFDLPEPTEEQMNLMRSAARCMQTDDAVLCNLTAEDRTWEECANTALVGQFVVWFDLLGGRRTDKRVYVAVVCGNETVTVSSLRRFPSFEFTLARRQNDEAEEKTRTVIFIQTG
ncbi:MAG TPA: hypothetical protein VEQ60_28675 [Longimicrobium sp.]|nr:hypothetical protein [Longimicrobium sp.]